MFMYSSWPSDKRTHTPLSDIVDTWVNFLCSQLILSILEFRNVQPHFLWDSEIFRLLHTQSLSNIYAQIFSDQVWRLFENLVSWSCMWWIVRSSDHCSVIGADLSYLSLFAGHLKCQCTTTTVCFHSINCAIIAPCSVSKQQAIVPGQCYELEDGTSSFKDFHGSRNNRFTSPEQAAKNRIQHPSNVLHFFNAQPDVTPEVFSQVCRTKKCRCVFGAV